MKNPKGGASTGWLSPDHEIHREADGEATTVLEQKQLEKVLLVKATFALLDAKTQPPLPETDPLLSVSPEKVT